MQVVGDRLRVNVQLIDPVTDVHLWDERYDAHVVPGLAARVGECDRTSR